VVGNVRHVQTRVIAFTHGRHHGEHIQVHVHWTISSASCLRQNFCADIDNCQTEVVTFLVCSLIVRVNYWMNCCCHRICSSGYCSTWV
jgi:hypothetical protein